MNLSAINSKYSCLRGWIIVLLILAPVAVCSQTNESPGPHAATESSEGKSKQQEKQPPAFSAAGVQGSTAPSGYSAGLSREETSDVGRGINDLTHEHLSTFVPDGHVADCRNESEVVKAARAEPKTFQANYALGVFYLEHRDFVKSIPYLEAARRVEPQNISSLRALALALLGAKRNSEAIALLEPVRANEKSDPASLRLLALAYQISGDRQKSAEIYQRAASIGGADNQFDCGIGLIRAGALDLAAKVFSFGTIAYPNQANLWLGLGLVQDLKRQKTEAVQSLLQALAIDPDYAPPYYFLAGLADASPERRAEIRKRLAEFVVAHPNNPDAHYNYALALSKQHRVDPEEEEASTNEIKSQLKLALALDPNMTQAYFQLGVVSADAKDFSSAEQELLRAVQLEPNNAEAHYRLAQVYGRVHKPQLASAEMQRFLGLHNAERTDQSSFAPELLTSGADLTSRIIFAPPCDRQP